MPTLEMNKEAWDGGYPWTNRGDEWSAAWGSPSVQWYGSILPRIREFVPAGNVLEIACGYGRWTQFLKDMCDSLVCVDISEECIRACRQRYSGCSHIEFHRTDGKSLDMLADSSVDLVFSFDSLVHADMSVMQAYLSQLPRILRDDGAAFIHHSNLGEYQATYARIRRIPRLEGLLRRLGLLDQDLHWRDFGVSAGTVEALAEDNGLKCVSQEVVPWGTTRAKIDCFSTLVKDSSSLARSNRVLRNADFMQEASYLCRLSHLYTMREAGPDRPRRREQPRK